VAIELPSEVVTFLQMIGVNWPNVNEDKVREFGQHVREFADNVSGTHADATSTVTQLGQAYQGASYEAMFAKWGQMSSTHMTELVDICNVVATALDVGADVIVGMKGVAIAELIGLAASFIADQAAAIATFGIAEAAEALIVKLAEELMDYLEQQLTQYVIGQIIEAAITPLVGVVEKAVNGMVYSAVESALGVSGPGGAGSGVQVAPADALTHAQAMHGHAETIAGHAQTFTSNLAGLSFE
jgi:uncharacterized protein YukE